MVRNEKRTENGDRAYRSTTDRLLDLFFMTEYYSEHLDEVKIGTSKAEKLFAMFVRDCRLGLGKRDLGRELMKQARVPAKLVAFAGRFDDLYHDPTDENIKYLKSEVYKGNELAKKWCPRLTNKDRRFAKALCREWGLSEKEYRKLIKVTTTETLLTEKRLDEIDYEKVPSLAMIKYGARFMREEKYRDYLEGVKAGDKKLNVATATVYDIYRNRFGINAQVFFDKIEKIGIDCIPILDTSASMNDHNNSIGKATALAHYLSKCSTCYKDYVVSFSSMPALIHMGYNRPCSEVDYGFKYDPTQTNYMNEVQSLYTGDCSNTDFGAVMELLAGCNKVPKYLVVLSDMEFDEGSTMSKDKVMRLFKEKCFDTKIIWWNLNARHITCPETDDYGNIFMSGYSPVLLKYLEAGFDGKAFLTRLLKEYLDAIKNNKIS